MSRIYKSIIFIVSLLVVICFAAVMFSLYGHFDDKVEKDINYLEQSNINITTKKFNIDIRELDIASSSNADEIDKEKQTTDEQVEKVSEDEITDENKTEQDKLSNLEYYQASSNFEKVEIREKKDVFCFAGDVFLSKKPRMAYDEKGIDGIIDESFLKILQSSDFNVANLECSITDDTENAEDKTFTFALPAKYIDALKEVGINLFSLANNHIMDYGADSMLNTIKVLDDNGIHHVGAGKNVNEAKRAYIKELDGKRYAFLAASAVLPQDSWKASYDRAGVFNGYDIRELCEEIERVKPFVDKVIVYMHWGRELETVSNTWQKQYARRIVNAGADLVVGSHSHTVQEIEYYNNVPIIYSLGNFIYGGTMRDTVLITATFDYSIDKNGQLQLQIFTGLSNYEKVRRDWKKDEIAVKLKELQDKSSTCYIADNGYVFTMEQVMEALKNISMTTQP